MRFSKQVGKHDACSDRSVLMAVFDYAWLGLEVCDGGQLYSLPDVSFTLNPGVGYDEIFWEVSVRISYIGLAAARYEPLTWRRFCLHVG